MTMRTVILSAAVFAAAFPAATVPIAAAQAPRTTIPLVTGLAVVGAVREPAGDYESVRRVTGIASDRVAFTITADVPGQQGEPPQQVEASRTVLATDLKSARTLKVRISSGWNSDEIYPGTTTAQLSIAELTELRATGHTSLTFIDDGTGGVNASTAGMLEKMMVAASGGAVCLATPPSGSAISR